METREIRERTYQKGYDAGKRLTKFRSKQKRDGYRRSLLYIYPECFRAGYFATEGCDR